VKNGKMGFLMLIVQPRERYEGEVQMAVLEGYCVFA